MELENKIPTSDISSDLQDVDQTLKQPLTGFQRFLFPLKDQYFTIGLVFIALSIMSFIATENTSTWMDIFSYCFVFCFGLSLLYAFILWQAGRLKWIFASKAEHYSTSMLYLVLWLISCFALNRTLTIFNEAADWWSAMIVTSSTACIAYGWRNQMSYVEKSILYAFLGVATFVFIYFTLTLLPVTLIGSIVAWFFGISLHAWVPFVFTVYLGFILRGGWLEHKANRIGMSIGILLPIVALGIFSVAWKSRINSIKKIQDLSRFEGNTALPNAILLSQQLPKDMVTERILKSDLVYPIFKPHGDIFSTTSIFSRGGMFENQQRFDPFVHTASIFTLVPEMDYNERIQIFKAVYGQRHLANDQLWSGNNLYTDFIETKTEIDAPNRLAYTEKVLTIKNNTIGDPNNQGEAIYTFMLPEGSVVSSLSLWVNGVEEKALLTTRSKADSAYRTIVGQERRDPSVVHWQEGNQVTVRVFPIQSNLPRRFKIGVTSPLRLEKNKLYYENINFEGPSLDNAKESIGFKILDNSAKLENAPVGFKSQNDSASYLGSYLPQWAIGLNAPKVSEAVFNFNDKTYKIEPFSLEKQAFNAENIYLDINQAWTIDECNTILNAIKNKSAWIFDDTKMVQLTPSNASAYFAKLTEYRFSLFPFHKIEQPEKALIITKSNQPSPNLDDLKKSRFAESVKNQLHNTEPFKVFNIGNNTSAYQKTFKELRISHLVNGSVDELTENLTKNEFYKYPEDISTVVIPSSGLRIVEMNQTSTQTSEAPDHLLRLFTYNTVLKDLNKHVFEDDYYSKSLIDMAEKAHIVTPISSLIVLETQADYDRFDIKNSKNSLGNAGLKSSGAVPEPHEWALIFLLASMIAWLFLKKKITIRNA